MLAVLRFSKVLLSLDVCLECVEDLHMQAKFYGFTGFGPKYRGGRMQPLTRAALRLTRRKPLVLCACVILKYGKKLDVTLPYESVMLRKHVT